MKRLISFLAFIVPLVFIYQFVFGATYYVSNCGTVGNDTNDGLSTGAPWLTIAKVNSSSFSGDDQILFNKGCTWREQLTVPSSGTNGHPITFGAYPADGAKPIITGADLATGWSAQSANASLSSDGFEVGDADLATDGDGAYWTGSGSPTGSLVGNETSTKLSGTYAARASWTATGQNALAYHTITQTNNNYVQVAVNVGNINATQQARLASYNNGGSSLMFWIIYVSPTTYKINLHFSTTGGDQTITGTTVFNVGTWYTVEAYYKAGDASTGGAQYWINGTSEGSSFTGNTTQANNQPNRAYIGFNYGTNTGTIYFDNYKYGTSYIGVTFPNVWQATATTQPSQVFFNGTRGTQVDSVGALTGVKQWYWASNILYIYSTSDPTTAYTSPGIEASVRSTLLTTFNRNYLTIQDLELKNSAISTSGAVHINGSSSYDILQRLNVHDNDAYAGIYFETSGAYNQVLNSTIYNTRHTAGDRGVGIISDNSGGYHTFSGNTIYSNTANGINLNQWAATSNNTIANNNIYNNGSSGISIGTNCASNTIQNNIVYSNGQLVGDRANIDLFQAGNNNIVRYNTTHDMHWISLDASGIRFDTLTSTGNQAYYNVSYNDRTGITTLNCTHPVTIYNNSIYNSTVSGIEIHGATNSGTIIKNNIIHTAGTNLIWNHDAIGTTIDYNDYYPTTGTLFNWNETSYNFTNWKTNSSQDSNSINSDPKFTSTVTPDFHLQPTSPCRNAGAPVGLITDFAGLPIVGLPDIGAYEIRTNDGDDDFMLLRRKNR